MARISTFLFALCVLACGVELCSSSNSVVQSLKCHMPNSTVAWESSPEMKTVDVEWKYGSNHTCYTPMECFGAHDNATNRSSIGVQLRPIQLQNGNKLRFALKRYVKTIYPSIYKVNATAFRACDVSHGEVIRKDNGSDVFEVPSEFLSFGNNYFIVATNYSAFVSCDLGLRLNVTVKNETCTGTATEMCGGRGLCVTNQYQDKFACHCCGTYKGENCSIFDACLSSPCQNGGECIQGNNATKKTSVRYQCNCAIGFNGTHCEHKAQNVCDLVQCQNGGTCSGNATSFNCTCTPGWMGSQCEVNINDCESMPCRHGHCMDMLNGYNCSCYPGYHGENCQFERTSCKFSPCQNGGFCENQTTSDVFKYACHCPAGWNGTDCSQRVSPCQNISCANHGLCMELYDGFKCACQPGFTGTRCEVNINDCEPNPCLGGGQCYDLEQGHLCRCIQTHYGDNCQYTIPEYGYSPALDGVVTHVILVHDDNNHYGTLYVVAGVITAGVLVVILLLAGCYYRTTESYRRMCGLKGLFGRKPNSDLTVQVNFTNTPDCPMTTDSFFQGSKHDIGVDNKAFQNELV